MKKIVICGRPNVGKSSFINRLLGKKTAITAREAGVTRDLRYYEQVWNGKPFKICDTGGVIFSKEHDNPYQKKINEVVLSEIDQAHKIIFMVDFNFPNHPEDQEIRKILKSHLNKCALVINKVDNYERKEDLHEFYSYGVEQIYPISAIQGNGIGDLCDYLVNELSKDETIFDNLNKNQINVALIGKPNVGKSSLYNAIFNENKALVDNKMGTTRDINQSIIKVNKQEINFMDTAGLRRRRKITDTIEYFSIVRTDRAIENADIIVFIIDAEELLTDQDKKILNTIFEQNKNCIIYVNKWDLLERNEHTRNDIVKILEYELPPLNYYPIIMGSAIEKHNIQSLLNSIITVYDSSKYRVTTGKLNQFLEHFFEINHPPSKKGKLFKIYYATQIKTAPPKFIFKVNDSKLLSKPFLRHFEKEFRKFYPNSNGVGISFEFRSKQNV